MPTLYKLTDENSQTKGGMLWGVNVTHRATGNRSQGLCSTGFLHAYRSPDEAVLFNPIHGNIVRPILWEARGKVVESDALKVGCRQLTIVKKIRLPKWTVIQRVAFAILCAQEVYDDKGFREWAIKWLSGDDRTAYAAYAADAAYAAARAAAYAAAYAAADAADAAAYAAYAAYAATEAADAARAAPDKIDFAAIVKKARRIK